MNNGQRYFHQPVLLPEVLDCLAPKPGENFVDATLGGGGYSRALLQKTAPAGKVIAIDLDEAAIDNIKLQITNNKSQTNSKFQIPNPKSLILHQGNFKDIDKIVRHYKISRVNGIVADLGFSSYQLDESGRGLSFQKKEILDMRFDKSGDGIDARFILNNYDEKQLIRIFQEYGEEKFSRQIAKKIIQSRANSQEIKYTTDLYQIIKGALPKPIKHKSDDNARRIFQALRIAVNHELENLQEFLPKAFNFLASDGRLAVISFHSLEDRMVKQYFTKLCKGCVCPPEFPICKCGRSPEAKLVSKKPIVASEKEIKLNPRSKPAKLRAIIKIK